MNIQSETWFDYRTFATPSDRSGLREPSSQVIGSGLAPLRSQPTAQNGRVEKPGKARRKARKTKKQDVVV